MQSIKRYVITTHIHGGHPREQTEAQKSRALKLAQLEANNKRESVEQVTVDLVTRQRIHTAVPRRLRGG